MSSFLYGILIFIVLVSLSTCLVLKLVPDFGAKATGERYKRILRSHHFKDGIFQNPEPTRVQPESIDKMKLVREMFNKGNGRIPEKPIQVKVLDQSNFRTTSSGLKITWLGHSTVLIEIDGVVILADPVFSSRISPFSFVGTKNFDYSHPFSVEELPKVDIVLLSHDHYDHLDYRTILKLKDKVDRFVMPLGVGAHLEKWGVDTEKINELDWWEEISFAGIKLTATPARHFSGRKINDRFKTLWASFALTSRNHQVFFGGDSGYHSVFKTIGERFGSFDICMLECGQYNKNWPYIHSFPEQTVQAGTDLNAKIVMPIHWGKVRLSLHSWTEPVERFIKQAKKDEVKYTTPQIGETIDIEKSIQQRYWWRDEPVTDIN